QYGAGGQAVHDDEHRREQQADQHGGSFVSADVPQALLRFGLCAPEEGGSLCPLHTAASVGRRVFPAYLPALHTSGARMTGIRALALGLFSLHPPPGCSRAASAFSCLGLPFFSEPTASAARAQQPR